MPSAWRRPADAPVCYPPTARATTRTTDGHLDLAPPPRGDLAVVLTGGGARAAYQVGLLRWLARRVPDLRFDVVTGVSAGAINASLLAAHPGSFAEAVDDLDRLWRGLTSEDVFRVDTRSLAGHLVHWAGRLVSGGGEVTGRDGRGLVDTSPLDELLHRALAPIGPDGEILGIAENLERGRLGAVGVTTLDYATGQTITWVQGRDVEPWVRTNRRSVETTIRVRHVVASAALPLFFPAVQIDGGWHGDGGVRHTAPLSPALHLGADRILAVSTRYVRTREEQGVPETVGYPPPAQILGHLMKAVFLDVIDQDVRRLELMNRVIDTLPPEERGNLRHVDILALRPSVDLGRLAAAHEPTLPPVFRFLTRGLGTRETRSPDFLSMLLFEPAYLGELIAIGEADAEARAEELERLVAG